MGGLGGDKTNAREGEKKIELESAAKTVGHQQLASSMRAFRVERSAR